MTFTPRRFPIVGLLFAITLAGNAGEGAGSAASEEQARELIKGLQVPSPYRISERALGGKIRYELAFAGGAPLWLPETGEQHVERRGDHLTVTICRDRCGHERAPTQGELDRSLQPNPWVQSKDAVIADFAQVGRSGDSVDQRMSLLVKAVAERMSGRIEYQHQRAPPHHRRGPAHHRHLERPQVCRHEPGAAQSGMIKTGSSPRRDYTKFGT